MLDIYCRANHTAKPLCAECTELETYVQQRLDKCPFGMLKPTCKNCQIHCYSLENRNKIRKVMKFAGPRMLTRHPILAFCHLLQGLKKLDG